MAIQRELYSKHGPALSEGDVSLLVGDLEAAKIAAILAEKPTIAELEEALIWAAGEGEPLGKAGRVPAGVVARLYDILTADADREDNI